MTESSINIIIKTNSITSITRRGGATSVLNRTQIKNMQSRYLRNFFLVDLIYAPFKMGVASTFPFSIFNTLIVNTNQYIKRECQSPDQVGAKIKYIIK